MNIIKILFFALSTMLVLNTKGQVSANFTTNQNVGCTQLAVQYSDLSTGNITSWNWDLGAPYGTSSLQNPTNNYAPGIYPVCLTVSNGAVSDTYCDTIKVYNNPIVSFTASPLNGCAPLDVQFTNNTITETGIDSVMWTFGDGGSTTALNPQHTYPTGTFSVSLWVQDNAGCFFEQSVSNYVSASDGLTADFTSTNAQSCAAPALVNFQNTSLNAAGATYLWDFGVTPTVTSTATNPSHNYTSAGSYDVTLITSNNGCSDTIIQTNFVTIQLQNADFTVSNTSVCVGETVSFTDISTLTADSWQWNFGTGAFSTMQNPDFTYNTSGVYSVTMVAYLTGCNDSIAKTNYITVNDSPNGSFVSDVNNNCSAPFTVNFTSSSSPGNTYLWDFGEAPGSTLANPTHTYNSSGSFDVSLTITNMNNCSTTIDSLSFINIYPPIADFDLSSNLGCAPQDIDFTDLSSSVYGIETWAWDFGDGTTQNGPSNPTHTYTNTGNYFPSLIVTDSLGCTNSFTGQQIILGEPLIPQFTYTPDTTCGSLPVNFQNTTDTTNIDSTIWNWSFGDGGTYQGYQPPGDYIYSDTGYMTVTLQTIHNGCIADTVMDSIIYVLPPIAIFTEVFDCDTPENVLFIDQSIGPDAWNWYIDGDTVTTQNANYTFADTGTYYVLLEVENFTSGCTDSIGKNITIVDPFINFSYDDSIGCPGLTVNFTNESIDALESYWNFGDGNWYTVDHPSYTFNNPGMFDVTLAIRSLHDCYDTLVISDLIQIFDVDANFITDTIAGCAPLNVNFTDSSTSNGGTIITWQWDFGDGSPTESTQNASHNYTYIGNFTSSLTVTDSAGCTSTHNVIIATSGVDVSFINDSVTCNYDSVIFTSTTPVYNPVASWHWDFGDNTTSNLENPSHNYLQSNSYEVILSITDVVGCSGADTTTIYIDSMYADFSASDSIINCAGSSSSATFYSFTPSNTTSWDWNFPSSLQNPTVNFSSVGVYDVVLTATNSNGCIATETKPNFITINGPYARLQTSEDSICVGTEITFLVDSTNSVFQKYVFGGGVGLNTPSFSENFVYNTSGSYLPTVILTDSSGCEILYNFNQIYVEELNAEIYVDTNYVCNPELVNFIDSSFSTAPITEWEWNLDGSFLSSNQNTNNNFITNGTHPIELIVTNAFCSDTVNDSIIVNGPSATLNNTPTIGCTDLVTNFTLTNLISQEQIWNFGEGVSTTNIVDSINYTYSNVGTFFPTVIIRDAHCLDTLAFDSIQVGSLQAAIFVDTNYICNPEMVNFIDSSNSSSAITNWEWHIDGILLSTNQNTNNNFTTNGTHPIELIVTNAFCSDTINDSIIVNGPTATLNNTPTIGCTNLETNFTLSNLISQEQIWNFGEGVTITNSIDSMDYTYSNIGVFYPTVIIRDAHCLDTLAFDSIQVGSLLAQIYTDTNNVCISDPISFMDTSIAFPAITNWHWTFANGDTSILENPVYTFSDTGTFEIQLIVDNSYCEDTTTTTIFSNGPFATFSNTPTIGCINLAANFDLSLSNSESQIWNFGVGADVLNNSMNMNYTYTTEGTYHPYVIISEANCIDTLLFDSIQVGSLNADFIADSNYVCAPDNINFYDSTNSIPAVTSWSWDFGDGNSSNIQSPNHIYSTHGVYNVKLVVENDLCQDSLTINQYIVSDTSTLANFQILPPAYVCPPVSIDFINLSSADSTIASWNWNFDNGVTNNSQTPGSIVFDSPDVYHVTLDITTIKGCTSTYEDSIEVNIIPAFSFDLDTIELCRFDEITLDSLGTDSYYWSPGMNLSCTDCPNPTITSLNNLVYEVLAVSPEGCEYTDSLTFIVNELPNLTASEGEKVTYGTTVSLHAFSTENVVFDWQPIDKIDCINCADNDYTAIETTEFIVNATDSFGCITSDTILIEVFDLCNGESIFLPNIFTPNDDGKNDAFRVTTLNNLKTDINYFRIFDRWGKLVFETNDISDTWDGNNKNGQKQQNGVYVYMIEAVCSNGETILLNGNVTLIR